MADGQNLFANQPLDAGQPVEDPNKKNLFYTDAPANPSAVIRHNLDRTVAEASPALYAAGAREGMTREEKNIVENWSKIKVLHEKLMAMPNAKSEESFNRLDPAWQGALQKYYQVDYKFKTSTNTNSDDMGWRQVLGVDNGLSMGDLFKSPFRLLMWAGMEYGKAFNTVGNLVQDATINRESFWTRDNGKILDSFEGKMLYDESVASGLIEQYGGATSFVAMHLLKGDTPGEIIDAWGPNDGEILKAVNSMFNDPDNFQKVVTDFKRAQLSPGRDIARWVSKTFNIDTEQRFFDMASGSLDMAYQIFADPLTYLTLGGSAIVKGAKAAEKIAETLKTTGDVAQYLSHAKVAEYFTGWTEQIGRYADAVAVKDYKAQAEITDTIRTKFPEFSQDAEINLFAKAGVRDLAGLTEYLAGEGTQNMSRLLRGLTTDMRYAREGAVYARKHRALISGAKETFSELFKGKVDYAALDKTGFDDLTKQIEDNGRISTGVTSHDLVDKQIEETSKRGFQKLMSHLSAKHPGTKTVYVTDDKVALSLNTFRQQAFLALEDKAKADVLAATFLDSSVESRIAMLRGMHEMIYRRMGVHGTAGGENKIAQWLDTSFSDYNKFGARETLKAHPDSPAALLHNVTEHTIEGPIYMSQFKDGFAAPQFLEASQTVARGKFDTKQSGIIRSVPGMIGGAFNSKAVDTAMNHWTWLTLAPMLGVRTAIDEGFFAMMYLNFGQARELRNARRWRNVISAYTGEKSAIGPYKAAVQNIFKTGPTRLISDATVEAVSKKHYGMIGKGHGDTWEAERAARLEIFDMCLDSKYGKKIPAHQREWLKEAALLNPTILKQASAVHVQEATGFMKQGILQHDVIPSGADKALEEAHLTLNKDFSMESLKNMSLTDAYTAMYHQFFTRFNGKPYHFTGPVKETAVDPSSIFIKHHNQRTDKFEWDPALEEFMNRFGYEKMGDTWKWKRDITEAQKENLKLLVQSTRHFDQYKYISSRIGIDEDATGQALFRFGNDVFNDLYHVFHGGVDNYNHNLVEVFKDSLVQRNVSTLMKSSFNGAVDYRQTLKGLDFDTYAKAMNGYVPDGRIATNINFNPQPTNLNDNMRNWGTAVFDMMSRQSDGIVRQPLVHVHYMAYRKEYQVFEKQYAEQTYKGLAEEIKENTDLTPLGRQNALANARAHSVEQAKHFYAERAMIDAANNVLKYADNPEMRSVFAYNMRTVGRFYRAVEDFYRRIYRLGTENGMGTIARLRLMNQGLSANGAVHTDENGEQYMVLPMDNIIYGAVNSTLRALTGNEMEVKQPIFSNLTFKLTAGNPSFQSDAGMPYLSGPMGSISVLAAKSLLGKFNPTKNLAEDLDNLFLGDMGDNVDFRKAVTPRLVNSVWSMLSPDEQSQQEVSAVTQAIAYNQANGYGINLDDPKYLKADGSIDEGLLAKDKAAYLSDLRVSAHNIIVTRTLLGMIFPASVQSKDIADLPDYLKDTGITSMQSSFYEMVDSIKKSHPDVQSPYELALATWMGENKGKLAYVVSKKDSKIQPMLSFSTQMQDWAIGNSSDVSKYGAGALLFAPNIGKFNAGVWNWTRAAGITSSLDVDNYFNMVTMQQHVNAYYAIADQEAAALKEVRFNDPVSRRAITTEYENKRRIVKLSIPGLDAYLRSGTHNTESEDFVNNAFAFANDPNTDAPKEIKQKIIDAYNVYQNFMSLAAQIDRMGMSSPSDVKRAEKDKAIAQIKILIKSDSTKTVEQYFNYGLLKLMTAKSKDATAGIGRNV